MDAFGPSCNSTLTGPVPFAVRAAAKKLWGDVPVINGLQFGSTDSKYLREIGIAAYGIDTAPASLEDTRRGFGAHGANERAPLKWLPAGTQVLRGGVRGPGEDGQGTVGSASISIRRLGTMGD